MWNTFAVYWSEQVFNVVSFVHMIFKCLEVNPDAFCLYTSSKVDMGIPAAEWTEITMALYLWSLTDVHPDGVWKLHVRPGHRRTTHWAEPMGHIRWEI